MSGKKVRECVENHDETLLSFILEAVKASDALDYTGQMAQDAANEATRTLSFLRDSQYKNSLIKLSTFSAERNY